ncbi:hypothetical protein [Pseudomonas sp. TTU2014-080ASC]|uniref:hypothetical protein n=1 Tax=Pseudomonas sp. TTU2014-080ASC TaxID=1729724 RepID=UPI000718775F|nr:hypothetical protein [Pseudomonas sp. TTU2014-080ASC]KRW61331.1 hypothetical protein AO726_08375 [Pseudomonas sp. TTU2014-080ASC]
MKNRHQTFTSLVTGLLLSLALMLTSWPAKAEVLLTLEFGEKRVDLSREQLLSLPQHEIKTTTVWTDGVRQFKGPLVRDVLGLLDAPLSDSANARLIALNEYEVKVAVQDYLTWDVILAWEQDGQVMTRLDKGPLWVVYPRDKHVELQDSRFDHRWAWMLRTISIEP